MIYTLTLNPALDYAVSVPNFKTGSVNRTQSEKILPGGKGINVSVVLHNLGVESVALGFIAGFTGEEIRRLAEQFGCKTDFIRVKNGLSRINVKMKADVESEISAARRIFSVDITKFNTKIQTFPTNMFAAMLGYKEVEPLKYEVEDVKVQF